MGTLYWLYLNKKYLIFVSESKKFTCEPTYTAIAIYGLKTKVKIIFTESQAVATRNEVFEAYCKF